MEYKISDLRMVKSWDLKDLKQLKEITEISDSIREPGKICSINSKLRILFYSQNNFHEKEDKTRSNCGLGPWRIPRFLLLFRYFKADHDSQKGRMRQIELTWKKIGISPKQRIFSWGMCFFNLAQIQIQKLWVTGNKLWRNKKNRMWVKFL